MEFKYRATDKKPTTTTTTTPFPHSTATYLSETSLPGGMSGFPCFPANTFRMPAVRDVLWREMEKEKIRREIIAGEIARRRELEAEVRRELALERSLGGISMQRYLDSFQRGVNPTAVVDMNNIIGVSQPLLQKNIESPVEFKPSSPHVDKDKFIVLAKAKPDQDLLSAKRKAMAPAVCDTEPSESSGVSKKAKGEWWCELCQAGATSEASFKKHIAGKKHKAKEAALTTPMIGLDAKPNRQSPQQRLILEELNETVVDKSVVESKNEEEQVQVVENPSEKDTEEAGKTKAFARKKVWCEVCQIYTLSQVVMETHKKGKKHQQKMMKLSKN